jgi:hypothetical protein
MLKRCGGLLSLVPLPAVGEEGLRRMRTQYLRKELEDRQDELSLLETEHDVQDSFKISFRSFTVNDLALFLPTSAPGSDSQRVYLAFHLGCPHRFLSAESISSFSNEGARCVVVLHRQSARIERRRSPHPACVVL